MEFTAWLRTWLSRHPLKEPPGVDRARYTTEVMARIKALTPTLKEAPANFPIRPWAFWPRFALAVATAAAGIAVAVGTLHVTNRRFAQQVAREAQVLAMVAGPEADLVPTDDVETLHDELEMTDTLVLAEAQPIDEDWVNRTVKLLDQLNEEAPADAAGDGSAEGSDEDWLKELKTLDEQDLSA